MNVPEIIGNVVDSMRESGAYTSFTSSGSTRTINAVNTLEEDEWVTVYNVSGDSIGDFQVSNVTSSTFDIISTEVPTATGSYKSLEPFYMYGHRREISNRLLEKDADDVYKYQKYPLIALRLPISEDVQQGSITQVSLNIAILDFTEKTYTSEQRYDNIIIPVLTPLYNQFIEKLDRSGNILNNGTFEHNKIDRLFYGIDALEGNTAYIFNDPLDGIEIVDLNLKLIDNC